MILSLFLIILILKSLSLSEGILVVKKCFNKFVNTELLRESQLSEFSWGKETTVEGGEKVGDELQVDQK